MDLDDWIGVPGLVFLLGGLLMGWGPVVVVGVGLVAVALVLNLLGVDQDREPHDEDRGTPRSG